MDSSSTASTTATTKPDGKKKFADKANNADASNTSKKAKFVDSVAKNASSQNSSGTNPYVKGNHAGGHKQHSSTSSSSTSTTAAAPTTSV